jgi:hypothetical protein
MATVTKTFIKKATQFGGVPFGNAAVLPFNLSLASGIMVNSDQATALIATDVVRLGVLPAGMKLLDMHATISAALTATSTLSVGFLYVDGVDDTAVPQDAAYFVAALAAGVSVTRKTTTKAPLTLAKDAYLVVTNNVATQAATSVVDIEIHGIQTA